MPAVINLLPMADILQQQAFQCSLKMLIRFSKKFDEVVSQPDRKRLLIPETNY